MKVKAQRWPWFFREAETARFTCLFVSISLALLSCDLGTTRQLRGNDCKPRHMQDTEECRGEDKSFQECNFYFRVIGTPEPSWCTRLRVEAGALGRALGECKPHSPSSMTRIDCGRYGVTGSAQCYACREERPEASTFYFYAYDASCTRGVEQVTCNLNPEKVVRELGALEL